MNTELTRATLAFIVSAALGFCLWMLFNLPMPDLSRDSILVIIGALVMVFKDVFGYYFGSSEGSTRKTELLRGVNNDSLDLGKDTGRHGEETGA